MARPPLDVTHLLPKNVVNRVDGEAPDIAWRRHAGAVAGVGEDQHVARSHLGDRFTHVAHQKPATGDALGVRIVCQQVEILWPIRIRDAVAGKIKEHEVVVRRPLEESRGDRC